MRVISGLYKGRKLQAGKDMAIRPTTDRVKEYIFTILDDYIRDKNVVDIFSGSGNLGIEALSRGARHVTFVEKSRTSIRVMRKNLEALPIAPRSYDIIHQPAERFVLQNRRSFDIYFLDPPFDIPGLQGLMDTLMQAPFLDLRDLVVIEHETSNPLALTSPLYDLFRQKKMGRSLISFLQKKEKDDE
ncbi:MAG: 16S rRNA (guanine(966)-N(2))-methyltransferase RsmD [Calditrichaeota bacterium]|nr:MAG: 16S rRNA (guanine(966)-N(2))-methyltransferase RsmD [Calditrichota bacterium]